MSFSDFVKKKEFVNQRYQGAKKITNQTRDKSDATSLSYKHFNAKLPQYRRAITDLGNKRDPKWLKSEFTRLKSKLNLDKLSQEEFQKITGELEVVGELYIKLMK